MFSTRFAPRRIGLDSRQSHSQIFASGNHAEQWHWLAVFSAISRFSRPCILEVLHTFLISSSSALKTTIGAEAKAKEAESDVRHVSAHLSEAMSWQTARCVSTSGRWSCDVTATRTAIEPQQVKSHRFNDRAVPQADMVEASSSRLPLELLSYVSWDVPRETEVKDPRAIKADCHLSKRPFNTFPLCAQPHIFPHFPRFLLSPREQTTFIWADRVQSLAGSPDFRKWESCWTMPLVGGFSRRSPVSPALSFRHRSMLTSITLTGSQDHNVNSRPNLFAHIRLLRTALRMLVSCDMCGETFPSVASEPRSYVYGRLKGQLHKSEHTTRIPDSVRKEPQKCSNMAGSHSPTTYLQENLCEPGSITGRVTPAFSRMGIVPDDDTGQRVFSGSPVSPPFHSGVAPFSPHFTLIGSQDVVKSHQNLSTPTELQCWTTRSTTVCDTVGHERMQTSNVLLRNILPQLVKLTLQMRRSCHWPKLAPAIPVLCEAGYYPTGCTRKESAHGRRIPWMYRRFVKVPSVTTRSEYGMKRRGKREILEQTRQPVASFATIPTCENRELPGQGLNPDRLGGRQQAYRSITAAPYIFEKLIGLYSSRNHLIPGRYRKLLASYQGEPGSIPGRFTPGFSQMGIELDDAAGRPVFSGSPISHALSFRHCSIPTSLHPRFPMLGAAQIVSLTHSIRLTEGSRSILSLLTSHLGDPGLIPGRVTPDYHMWESYRTMLLVDGFSRDLPLPPNFHYDAVPYSPQSSRLLSRPRCFEQWTDTAEGLLDVIDRNEGERRNKLSDKQKRGRNFHGLYDASIATFTQSHFGKLRRKEIRTAVPGIKPKSASQFQSSITSLAERRSACRLDLNDQ
ncbi:hypothetical protein PR048_005914, partial [Dryococelus australis]